jgi:hypothetical protein
VGEQLVAPATALLELCDEAVHLGVDERLEQALAPFAR